MQNNYYLLRQLTMELKPILYGAQIISCFSQNKDELIIHFETPAKDNFFIRAHLRSDFSCLSFPAAYARARKNSVNLFPGIIDKQVKSIYQYDNERAFSITLENDLVLLFKMHGNRSNIILFQPGQTPILFKNELTKDGLINLFELDRSIEQSFEAYQEMNGGISDLFPTFNVEMKKYIESKISGYSPEKSWLIIQDFINKLAINPVFHVLTLDDKSTRLTMLEGYEADFSSHSAIAALNYFYDLTIKTLSLGVEKRHQSRIINAQIKRTKAYLKKVIEKRDQLISDTTLQQTADILMANLHVPTTNSNQIKLLNFYNNEQVAIKINPRLTLQKNAENYYRKSKNLKIEIKVINTNIKKKQEQLAYLSKKLQEVATASKLKELKQSRKLEKGTKINQPGFKTLTVDGYQLLIGKNAKLNDELTLKYAKPNDLWLHAKDVTGSHVVVKNKPGHNYPKSVIEKAAQIAAFYSKRKTDSLCPVIYTPKKFVRKRKGLPPGAMIVEKENVILVEPRNINGD